MNQGLNGWSQNGTVPSFQQAFLAANVTMTTAGTFYDGPSLLLGPGVWLVIGAADCSHPTVAPAEVAGKLWDGVNAAYASSETYVSTAGAAGTVRVSAIVTLITATTVKISASNQSGTNGVLRAALVTNSQGNTATYIQAVKLA